MYVRTGPLVMGFLVFSCCDKPVAIGLAYFHFLLFEFQAPLHFGIIPVFLTLKWETKHFLESLKSLESREFLSRHSWPLAVFESPGQSLWVLHLVSWETLMRPKEHFRTVYSDWAALREFFPFPYEKQALTCPSDYPHVKDSQGNLRCQIFLEGLKIF